MKLTFLYAPVIAIAFTGCATTTGNLGENANSIDFNSFTKENASQTGIAQVFEMDGNTVIQMRDTNGLVPKIIDEQGNPVPFKQTGNYLVLQRATPKFTVVQGSERAIIAKALGLPLDTGKTVQPSSSSKQAYTIKTSLSSLPNYEMNETVADIAKRDKYLKTIESLQAQINEIRAALSAMKFPGQPVNVVGTSYKQKKVAYGRAARKSKGSSNANKAAGSQVSPSPSDDNAIAKLRADVAHGAAPASSLDSIDRLASTASHSTSGMKDSK